jgi:uncharacterized membrane protein
MPFRHFGEFQGFHSGIYLLLPMVLNLLVISAAVLFGILLYRHFAQNRVGTTTSELTGYEHPEDILKRRFAEGLISKEEFEEKMSTLLQQTHHPI